MWSRLDWKRGRFNVNTETTLIHRGLRGWQRLAGDVFSYWRFDYGSSEMHSVYDEGSGVGRQFQGPWQVPALHVVHVESQNTDPRDSGLYITDTLHVIAEYDQIWKVGLTEADIRHGSYQRDRIAYDNILYQVQQVSIKGQIRRRDFIVGIDAIQIKNDELVNDPVFSAYARDPSQLPSGPDEGRCAS